MRIQPVRTATIPAAVPHRCELQNSSNHFPSLRVLFHSLECLLPAAAPCRLLLWTWSAVRSRMGRFLSPPALALYRSLCRAQRRAMADASLESAQSSLPDLQ